MRELTLEEIGVDLDRVIRLMGGEEKILQHLGTDLNRAIRLMGGEEKVIRSLGTEKVLQHFSPDDILRYIGEDQVIALVRSLGREKVRQLLEASSE